MKNGKSWSNLGLAYLSKSGRDNIIQAEKALKMAIRNGEDKNADTIMNLGTVSELLLHFADAMKYYDQAMVMGEGWTLPAANLGRVQEMINKAVNIGDRISGSKKLKNESIAKLRDDNDYIVLDSASLKEDPCQIAACLNKAGEVKYIALTMTARAYIRIGKTVIKIVRPNFIDLKCKGKTIQYHIIENIKDVEIVAGGARPAEVKPVSISSSLA